MLDVVADRFRVGTAEKARAIEAIEVALKRGSGRVDIYAAMPEGEQLWRFSTGLHCPDSDIRYADPQPALFSFNSAYGACETCRGFGRVIGVDYGLVIPDHRLTLRAGAIKPIQTPAWKECQDDLMRHAEAAGIPRDTPWAKLTPEQKEWVIEGSPHWKGKWNQQWYGVKRFFAYLESKAKMHIRVLLSGRRKRPATRGAPAGKLAVRWAGGCRRGVDLRASAGGRGSRACSRPAGPGLQDLVLPIDGIGRCFDSLERRRARTRRSSYPRRDPTRLKYLSTSASVTSRSTARAAR